MYLRIVILKSSNYLYIYGLHLIVDIS